MIIYLPKHLQPTGGTSTFARNFQTGMLEHGHKVVFERPHRYDILLASPRAPLPDLIHAKNNHIPIIHRLDGVFYPGTAAGTLWPLHNLPLRLIRNHFATSIIYQSQFSYQSANRYLGGSIATPSTVILNGVNTSIFSPQGPTVPLRDNPNQHLFITTGRFRRSDQIIPILKAFTYYRHHITNNAKLVVIGNVEKKLTHLPKKYASKNIMFPGIIPNQDLPLYLRAADVFLFTHLNPPCPNNVIEALACGLPIAGTNTGAMPEIVTQPHQGQLTADLSPQNLAQVIQTTHQATKNPPPKPLTNQTLKTMIDSYRRVIETTKI